jgi:dipeptidyl aminopeptidase/acylaminoacyl peptidase
VASRPYGTWPSALDALTVARAAGKALAPLGYAGGRLRWLESRPSEGGRTVVMDERDGELTPPGAYVRTRVHEYGGGAAWLHGDDVYYSEFSDGSLQQIGVGPIAPPGRYADGTVGENVWCVRERHEEDGVVNELVSILPEPAVVASGRDFYMAPRVAPDGRLAWIEWDFPNMPWDGTELRVEGELVAGGLDESVLDPQWSRDGLLHWLSDRTGWWNLYCEGEQLTHLDDAEIGFPAWQLGMSRYALLDDGRIVCCVTRDAVDELWVLEDGELRSLGAPWTFYAWRFPHDGSRVAFQAASPTEPPALIELDVDSGEHRIVARSLELDLDPAAISLPRAIEFPTSDGDGVAYAFFYPPTNPEWTGPVDERPPLRVICHGGPTGHTSPLLDVETQYFTSRGIGVVDVNHRGSTGYGRAFRRLLEGRWGEIDWQDCIAAARYLTAEGDADPDRTWIEGGSAGGYVVFSAMTFDPQAFAAGVSYFGVADVEALATDTHKFESRYLDSLIGPYPERRDLYRARSPVHAAERLSRPMLLLQGLDDKVVLPAQAEMMVEVLERKEIPHRYIAFEGEGHGFRKEENIARSLEETLSFVGEVLRFGQ